ncbi:Gfo/Idh/MocA family oxidoreductase [Chryseolinea sp. H1M3-3]|uniref:Gfo/Idh/MocA family protein n=1 Tax=Chryseolinea sp. H1M3-3 TaxID=3034144 RepID=UPI0023EB7F52|nr:Gfo/Idh/MocA family oxidoreductase [Chryseolinea sp. H1M3-3]
MSVNLNEVRWGIIGAGDVCEVKSGPALSKIKHSKLVAVMRRNAAKAQDFATRHGVPKWYDDAEKLIHDPEINAIYIATPPGSHETYTLMAAKAGKPVYVEKPMARTHKECISMVEACQRANVPLFTAYYRRSLPNFLKIQSLIRDGVIGDVRYVNILLNKTLQPDIVWASGNDDNWRIVPEVSGGGYFFDLASHQLDMMDFLFGPIKDARGIARNQAGLYQAEDIVMGNFQFESGIIGQGTWCFTTSKVSDKEVTTIVGSKGQISFPFFSDHSVTLEVEGKEKEVMKFDIPVNIQQPLIQTIVDELRGTGQCPSTGVSGARTNAVMEMLSQR